MKGSKKLVTILTIFGVKDISDHETILKRLEQGTDVNTIDSGGRTLLMEAVIQRDHDLVDLLVDRGADVTIRDRREWTALHFAAQEYDAAATKQLLLYGADANARDDYGNTVIATAVLNSLGRGDVIQVLLTHGADASVENQSGISALGLAKNISNYNTVQFLE